MPSKIFDIRTPLCLGLFFAFSSVEAAHGLDVFQRTDHGKTYLFTGFDVPTGVGGHPWATSLFIVNEPELVSLDWGIGLCAVGTNVNRYNAPGAAGIMLNLKSNFRTPIEPYVGVTGYTGGIVTGVAGVEPEFGFRANVMDTFVAELSAGDLIAVGSNTVSNYYPYNHSASGLVVSLRIGMRWDAFSSMFADKTPQS
jgi:hypothetical protein